MSAATVSTKGYTVTGLTVFHGVDAVQLIGWGGSMLSNTRLTALVLVPRMSIVYVDGDPFDIETAFALQSAKICCVAEPRMPKRKLVGIQVPFCTLSVISRIRAGKKRGYRYAAFSLGQYPCSLGNHAMPAAALEALAKHVAVT